MYAGYHPDAYWVPPKCHTNPISTATSLRHISEGSDDASRESDENEESAIEMKAATGERNDNQTTELERLRGIVEKQGAIMEQMLQEQCRLNETIQEMLRAPKQ